MTGLAVSEPAYGSPEWVQQRRQYIGASDVPMILGLSPFGSAYDVWLQKKGLATVEESDAMRWGHYHEANIAAEYARRFPEVRLQPLGTVHHQQHDWLAATCDRMVMAPQGRWPLEIKSTSERMGDRWGEEGTDDIPDHVTVQAQVQLMVTGLSFAHVAVLVGHSDCRFPYVIEADRELQEMILDECHTFYQRCMLGDDVPEITGPNSEQHLRKKYATHTTNVLQATADQAEIIGTYFDAYATRKRCEEVEKMLKPRIMEWIGGDYGMQCDAGKVLWYAVKGRESFDAKGLIKHLNVPEDVVQQFTRVGAPSRTFRPYPKGD